MRRDRVSNPDPVEPLSADGVSGADADLAFLARGGALNLIGVVSNAVFGFLLVVVVTRGFGATATGLFFESVALFHLLATASQWGAEVGVVRMVPRYRVLDRHRDVGLVIWSALLPAFVVGATFAVGLVAFADPLGRILTNGDHGADLADVLRVLAPFVPLAAASAVVLASTRGLGTMMPTTIVDKLGRAGAQPALALLVVLAGSSTVVLALGWATPIALALAAGSMWLAVLFRGVEGRNEPRRPAARAAVFREFWRFTAPRGLASMFAVAILWLDTLLLGSLRSAEEAGRYAAATRYLVLGQFIGVAIAQVVAPKLSELLAAGDRERGRLLYATATSWLMVMAWPLYLSMIVFGPALLSVFGSGYRGAGVVLAILGAAMLVATAVGPVDVVLLMAGKSSWNLFNTVVAVILNVVLNLLLIPPFGIKGAAAAWAASILANNLLPLAQVWRLEGLHPFDRGSIAAAVSAVLVFGFLAAAARAILGADLVALVVFGAVGIPAYLLLLWRFRGSLHLDALREVYPRARRRAAAEG
jgi:O-antigen/teichoic acid export membrane protein